MTAFKHAIALCGLSQREAAEFLCVSTASIASWCADRRTPPSGVWSDLAALDDQMDEAVEAALDLIKEQTVVRGKLDAIEISYSGERGRWPCAGTADAVEARIRLRLALIE